MNTTFRFTVHCDEKRLVAARETLRQAHVYVGKLEKLITEFLPESPVYQLNHADPGVAIPAPPELIELLELGSIVEERSGRAFYMLAKSKGARPEIRWTKDSVARLTDQTHLGFGAIGKGFALDKVRGLLFREGFRNFFLTAGGSSIVLEGFAGENEPWKWGWSWEGETGVPFAHTTGRTVAIGVSGLHEKGNHIFDPITGGKATSFRTALVATKSAAMADAYSTALFVLGSEGFHKIPDAALGFIDADGIPHWNRAFQNLWGEVPCQK